MSDRTLLELAAKAAGIKIRWQSYGNYFVICDIDDEGIEAVWNPLADDGDALRLAVKLGMQMYIWQPNDGIGLHYTEINRRIKESHNNDPYAATRRAIVRAAAEIGRNMK